MSPVDSLTPEEQADYKKYWKEMSELVFPTGIAIAQQMGINSWRNSQRAILPSDAFEKEESILEVWKNWKNEAYPKRALVSDFVDYLKEKKPELLERLKSKKAKKKRGDIELVTLAVKAAEKAHRDAEKKLKKLKRQI